MLDLGMTAYDLHAESAPEPLDWGPQSWGSGDVQCLAGVMGFTCTVPWLGRHVAGNPARVMSWQGSGMKKSDSQVSTRVCLRPELGLLATGKHRLMLCSVKQNRIVQREGVKP